MHPNRKQTFRTQLFTESGQGLTEYLILLVLISLASIAAVRSLGGIIEDKLKLIRNHIEKVSPEDRPSGRNRRGASRDS